MDDSPEFLVLPADRSAIQGIIANVLRVPPEKVLPDADLVYDLGAESIDFLDLLFQLDGVVGRHVLPEHWGEWLKARLPPGSPNRIITPRIIEEFASWYRSSGGVQPAVGEVQ